MCTQRLHATHNAKTTGNVSDSWNKMLYDWTCYPFCVQSLYKHVLLCKWMSLCASAFRAQNSKSTWGGGGGGGVADLGNMVTIRVPFHMAQAHSKPFVQTAKRPADSAPLFRTTITTCTSIIITDWDRYVCGRLVPYKHRYVWDRVGSGRFHANETDK